MLFRFEFPDTLELDEFVATEGKEHSEKEKGEFVYLLYAVLVHSGDFHGKIILFFFVDHSLSDNDVPFKAVTMWPSSTLI